LGEEGGNHLITSPPDVGAFAGDGAARHETEIEKIAGFRGGEDFWDHGGEVCARSIKGDKVERFPEVVAGQLAGAGFVFLALEGIGNGADGGGDGGDNSDDNGSGKIKSRIRSRRGGVAAGAEGDELFFHVAQGSDGAIALGDEAKALGNEGRGSRRSGHLQRATVKV
jgi:hypothetical protein